MALNLIAFVFCGIAFCSAYKQKKIFWAMILGMACGINGVYVMRWLF